MGPNQNVRYVASYIKQSIDSSHSTYPRSGACVCTERVVFLERMHLQGSDTPTTMPHMHAN